MKKKTYVSRIFWYQGIGFLVIIVFLWISEILFSASNTPNLFNWRNLIFNNVVVLVVAVPEMILTKRLVSRLYRLEGFLRICAWCKKMQDDDEWTPIEEYFREHFNVESSHGICPECFENSQQKLKNFKPN